MTDRRRDRPGRPRGERRPSLRPLPRGVRGRRRLQALAGEDRHRGRRPPLLPDHDEPPPAAHQRRLRGAVPAGPQRRRRAARLLARARHERLRRLRQGDRQPRHRGAQAPGAGVPRRHAVLRVRGAREARVAVQARPRHGARSTRACSTRTACSSPSSSGSCSCPARTRGARRGRRVPPAPCGRSRATSATARTAFGSHTLRGSRPEGVSFRPCQEPARRPDGCETSRGLQACIAIPCDNGFPEHERDRRLTADRPRTQRSCWPGSRRWPR